MTKNSEHHRMASDFKKRQLRWDRFDKLFALSKPEREKSCNKKNLVFLEKFVSIEMNNYTLPNLDNGQDFSEIIEVLRINYRHWNQRLTGLMFACHELRDSASERNLTEFTKTCPWNMLVEIGRNTASWRACD